MLSIAPTVLEINTDDINETRLQGWYSYWFNILTRSILLRNVSGIVALTREVAELASYRVYAKPTRVIADGIDLRDYRPLPAPKNSKPAITLVGSPGMVWHGVDKLIHLARVCPDLDIHIVGYHAHDFKDKLPFNVQIHGFLDRAGVMNVLAKTDVACGPLALHRIHTQEGSPLKVREAAACGIPILLAYHDPDLIHLSSECLLQLPNTEENVLSHIEKIRSFAYQMMGKRIQRAAIADLIDQSHKEDLRLAFFDEVMKNEHCHPT
jgi:glycosyltransferase involved in cell wall biosynthesis